MPSPVKGWGRRRVKAQRAQTIAVGKAPEIVKTIQKEVAGAGAQPTRGRDGDLRN